LTRKGREASTVWMLSLWTAACATTFCSPFDSDMHQTSRSDHLCAAVLFVLSCLSYCRAFCGCRAIHAVVPLVLSCHSCRRAFHAAVPFVLSCFSCCRAFVLSCLSCCRAFRAVVLFVLSSLRAAVLFVLPCHSCCRAAG